MINTNILIAAALFFFCLLFRKPLESDPVTHVLVQLPLLAICGWLLAQNSKTWSATGAQRWNQGGIAALLVAIFAISYWMLPRTIDASLSSLNVEITKFITLPLCVGGALAIGWPHAHPIVCGFLKAQAISMLVVMAFLYTHAPVRICNSYLVSDQQQLGYGFLCAALGLAILWTVPLLSPQSNSNGSVRYNLRDGEQHETVGAK